MKRDFWRSLAAVVAGTPLLGVEAVPAAARQHKLYQIDWGLAVDFWICLALLGLIRLSG